MDLNCYKVRWDEDTTDVQIECADYLTALESAWEATKQGHEVFLVEQDSSGQVVSTEHFDAAGKEGI